MMCCMAETPHAEPSLPAPESPGAAYGRLGIGYHTLDRSGVITDANFVFRSLMRIPPEKLEGPLAFQADIPPDLRVQFAAHYSSITQKNPLAVSCLETGDGRYMQIRTQADFDAGGEITGYESATIDITDAMMALQAGMNRALFERDESVEAANGFAHDLRGPITRVGGYAQLAGTMLDRLSETNRELSAEVEQTGEQIRSYLSRLQVSAAKANRIIDAYLALANVSHSYVNPYPVNMERVLQRIADEAEESAKEKRAKISIPEHMPSPMGREDWIERVFSNLMSNALKYGGEHPEIEMGSDMTDDGRIRYWVRDNGPGIPKEQQGKLFRKFMRLKKDPAVDGIGLGLSLVKTIVARLNGEVGVQSREGEGSLFFFILPPAPK